MKKIFFLVLSISTIACKKPYTPPAISTNNSYLVVEAVISNSADSIAVKLSRTVNLSNIVTTNPVTGATVSIENDQNLVYPLIETSAGSYISSGLIVDSTRKYRLRINTTDKRQYLSDFVPVINSPAIDSVTFSVQANGINIYLNTHDPKNNTQYYRWDYTETWALNSNYYSFYKSTGDTVIERNLPAEQVYQCWRSDTSSTILLATSAHLTRDVISNNPITFVDPYTGKLGGKHSIDPQQYPSTANSYSIQVRQYGLSNDAFAFWTNLKNSTQNLGGIFDSQPTQINGNIHNVNNPSETVIGYLSAGKISSRRIFISNGQIPDNLAITTNPQCSLDSMYLSYYTPGATVAINQENEYFNFDTGAQYYGLLYDPIAVLFNPVTGKVIGHTGSLADCVDCTLFGTNKKPAFWQ
jgi:Domain of unknown function (DUF4249)